MRAAYDRGDYRPTDVVRACLERIRMLEPRLNTFITINDRMLEDAERADNEIAAGRPLGPLHGVPVIIKDNMNQAGYRTTAGYAGFAADDRVVDPVAGALNGVDLDPQKDATVVARLKEAGAIIMGKSNLPDFGLDGLRADSSHNGDTLNPFDATFAPGASSTGSATAVTAGFGAVSLGTDTAGSILFPASAQSLVGLKPSFGLLPVDGIFPGLASHHDVAGPIAKTVEDVAATLDVLAATPTGQGYQAKLRRGALQGKVIGLFEPGQWAGELHPLVASHYQKMVEIIESLGARTAHVVFVDTDWTTVWNARTFFSSCNSYLAGVDAFLAGLGGANPASRVEFAKQAGFEIGLGTTAPLHSLLAHPARNVGSDDPRLKAVIDTAEALCRKYEAILSARGIDALFLPRSVNPLPNLDGNSLDYLGDQVVGTQVNEMGLPAITVPGGVLPDGRPIAVDFVGRAKFTEAEILAYAYDFEQESQLRCTPNLGNLR
ncbi:amidase [Acidisoma sp. L85]|uniref:amidase n=1 Tax=Acidisoma sp. L85 TaxID=1641850 RepID=UPI00131EC83E|nr:amidase [Acidisoma sp. L85]